MAQVSWFGIQAAIAGEGLHTITSGITSASVRPDRRAVGESIRTEGNLRGGSPQKETPSEFRIMFLSRIEV